jgi:hypothetical protein
MTIGSIYDDVRVTEFNMINFFLKNGATENMNVNGSVGNPVIFSYTAPAGKSALLYDMTVGIYNSGASFSPEKFANITTLTNGILFKINNTIIATYKTNCSLCMGFINARYGSTTVSWNSIFGNFDFQKRFGGRPLCLCGGSTISFAIQDDLRSIATLKAKIFGYLE